MPGLNALTRAERIALGGVAAAFVAAAVTKGMDGLLPFFCSLAALAGVAWLVALATDLLGEHTGPSVTGFLQSSLGNLPELFVVLAALHAGETEIALTSLIGSVLANALLVLGLAIIVGARAAPDGCMRFRARLPNDTATLLQVAVFGIVLVALVNSAGTKASHHITTISAIASGCILVVYLTWAIPYLRSDEQPVARRHEKARVGLPGCIALMAAAGAMAAFVSEWFIDALTPALHDLHISKAFAGLVIVAIAGNAVENVVGIQLTYRNQPDIALSVILQSPVQIAMMIAPALVLLSPLVGASFTLVLPPLMLAALLLAVVVTVVVVFDGNSNWLEGATLVTLYTVIAASFWWG
jgi:Ca2+:H+ antiporter